MVSREDVQNETAEELIAWGLSIETKLTKWEMDFLEDLDKKVKHNPLTEKQRVKLEQIVMEKG